MAKLISGTTLFGWLMHEVFHPLTERYPAGWRHLSRYGIGTLMLALAARCFTPIMLGAGYTENEKTHAARCAACAVLLGGLFQGLGVMWGYTRNRRPVYYKA